MVNAPLPVAAISWHQVLHLFSIPLSLRVDRDVDRLCQICQKRKEMFPQMKEDVEDETVAASDAVVMRTAGVLVVDMYTRQK